MTTTNTKIAGDITAAEQMMQMMSGLWISRGIYVAAKLGISDHLKEGPRTAADLAELTETHTDSLYRVMRMLSSVGIYKEGADRAFSLTPLSATLISDVPGSLRPGAIAEMGEVHYAAWGNILQSVRTGEVAFDKRFGMNIWQYFETDHAKADNFNRYMASSSEPLNQAISENYDFSPHETLIDVGGGLGGMISAILEKNSHLNGIVFDSPSVADRSKAFLADRGLADRCDAVGGDFFESVPAGGDVYSLRWILHDWEDSLALKILKNIHAVIPSNGTLLIAEAIVPENEEPHFSKFFDLIMLTMTGGRERTESEWNTLLDKARFRIERILPTDTFLSIIEAKPVE